MRGCKQSAGQADWGSAVSERVTTVDKDGRRAVKARGHRLLRCIDQFARHVGRAHTQVGQSQTDAFVRGLPVGTSFEVLNGDLHTQKGSRRRCGRYQTSGHSPARGCATIAAITQLKAAGEIADRGHPEAGQTRACSPPKSWHSSSLRHGGQAAADKRLKSPQRPRCSILTGSSGSTAAITHSRWDNCTSSERVKRRGVQT